MITCITSRQIQDHTQVISNSPIVDNYWGTSLNIQDWMLRRFHWSHNLIPNIRNVLFVVCFSLAVNALITAAFGCPIYVYMPLPHQYYDDHSWSTVRPHLFEKLWSLQKPLTNDWPYICDLLRCFAPKPIVNVERIELMVVILWRSKLPKRLIT